MEEQKLEFKNFWESKIFWVGMLSSLIAIGNLVAEFLQAEIFSADSFVLLFVGVMTIVLRVWFTETAINK